MTKYLIGLICSLLLITGCTKQKTDSEQGIELVVWQGFKFSEHTEFLKLIRQFEQDYYKKTGIKVTISAKRIPFADFEMNVRLAALGNRTPDIACFDALKVVDFAYHEVLLPLDTLKNFDAPSITAKRQEFVPGAFDTNVVEIKGKKHLYGLPQKTDCLALFWNRQMFRDKAEQLEAAGLDSKRAPQTWEEVFAYGKILTEPEKEKYGFAMSNSLWFTIPFFGCYQVSYITTNDQGKKVCALGDPRSVAALQLKVRLYQEGIEAGAWKTGSSAPEIGFVDNKYAMILMGPWNVERFRKSVDFGISLIPRISQEEAIRVGLIDKDASQQKYLQEAIPATNVGGQNLAIFRSCQHPEIAYEFINFIAGKQAQLQWCRSLGQLPINIAAADELSKDPETRSDIKIFMQQAKYSTAPPQVPRYGYLEQDIMSPEMELALRGRKSVKEALEDAAEKVNERILQPLQRSVEGVEEKGGIER